MNTKDQKQYKLNLLGQLKIATSQNKALKIDLFGEHRKLSYQGYIYQDFFFFLLCFKFKVLLSCLLRNSSAVPLCHGKSSVLTACWTFPQDCLFAFQENHTLQLPCLDSNWLFREHITQYEEKFCNTESCKVPQL